MPTIEDKLVRSIEHAKQNQELWKGSPYEQLWKAVQVTYEEWLKYEKTKTNI